MQSENAGAVPLDLGIRGQAPCPPLNSGRKVLVFDVGNSRLKAALYDRGRSVVRASLVAKRIEAGACRHMLTSRFAPVGTPDRCLIRVSGARRRRGDSAGGARGVGTHAHRCGCGNGFGN